MTKLRCAVLDDYQRIALTIADWGTLSEAVQVEAFSQHFETEDRLVEAIKDYDVIVIMRERTPFPRRSLSGCPA